MRGRSPGQLQRPTGVTVDTNGDIIIADYDNRWVSIFSPEGKFKVRGGGWRGRAGGAPAPAADPRPPWQTKIGAGRLMGPKGVAVDRNGHIIVVDNKACCVFIFQASGKLVTKFGSRGTAERQFAGTRPRPRPRPAGPPAWPPPTPRHPGGTGEPMAAP